MWLIVGGNSLHLYKVLTLSIGSVGLKWVPLGGGVSAQLSSPPLPSISWKVWVPNTSVQEGLNFQKVP